MQSAELYTDHLAFPCRLALQGVPLTSIAFSVMKACRSANQLDEAYKVHTPQ